MSHVDVIIIGAGAAGLHCAATAGYRGRQVLLLDNAKKVGRKILISGGGRCNFTNYNIEPSAYISNNKHFCKSALSRYTQWDFLSLIDKYNIAYHEKTLGQLFCDDSAKDIVSMLEAECRDANVTIGLRHEIMAITKTEQGFSVTTSEGKYSCESLVIATGGLSMPKLGATPFGYKVAQQFGLKMTDTCAGLVPFTWQNTDKEDYESLSGISLPVSVTSENGTNFSEDMLFTHRGLSGPAILQISSYWQAGQAITIDLLPSNDLEQIIISSRESNPKQALKTCLSQHFPKRLIERLIELNKVSDKPLNQLNDKEVSTIAQYFHQWQIKPNGTEGYRTAEVTLGGIDTDEISSKTMMAKNVDGLYFIGEVVDVSGWLGGYNFQWAWSSGWCAGQFV
ncbi:NAD(P)/FAD-dependent oxidoreductase [Psychrobium sp. 1_MG-2023]|uniref:NAD(P)/FAD-dependent oxidoreductase n=1 Tax=Psychrobium sp. 1_MG-2023 TaxID=3062624 RepID=UPI002733C263|nr:NAD(P)/FAD-dependent oxidoreductase [Psychrobium sp. 1_MG-2023]MDP2560413.1 NAD(P)/FAD-dependent oxidoreductase [Psychrobium sp. 1_MG-2023]